MDVTSRRRAIAAGTSALLAVVLAVAIAGRGCSADDETPVGAVRAFVSAARAGDREAVYELLGPRTRAHLEAQAQKATEFVGGSRRFAPTELMSVTSGGIQRSAPRDYELRERDGDTAVVDIVGADGTHNPTTVVKVDGRWRVELR
jgi:hypothetical protein